MFKLRSLRDRAAQVFSHLLKSDHALLSPTRHELERVDFRSMTGSLDWLGVDDPRISNVDLVALQGIMIVCQVLRVPATQCGPPVAIGVQEEASYARAYPFQLPNRTVVARVVGPVKPLFKTESEVTASGSAGPGELTRRKCRLTAMMNRKLHHLLPSTWSFLLYLSQVPPPGPALRLPAECKVMTTLWLTCTVVFHLIRHPMLRVTRVPKF
jgi:hypothetical protein